MTAGGEEGGCLVSSLPPVPSGSDAEELALARRACGGGPGAIEGLFQRFHGGHFTYALRILRDGAEAQDVVQDIFLAIVERRVAPPHTSVPGWLYRLATHRAIDRWRRRRLRRSEGGPPESASAPLTPEPDVASALALRERDAAVQGAVARLSMKLRLVVTLRYGLGLSYVEIAEALACSIGTVKSRLARAHARLREPLRQVRLRFGEA